MPVNVFILHAERFVVVKVGDLLLINIYLPCVGTDDRLLVYSDVLTEIMSWRQQFPLCGCIIGGDFNTDLNVVSSAFKKLNTFLADNQFSRCSASDCLPYTFVNETRNYFSNIDYVVYNNVTVSGITFIEPDINFSDHLPISVICTVSSDVSHKSKSKNMRGETVEHLRWDYANLLEYFNMTRVYLQPILQVLLDLEHLLHDSIDVHYLDSVYEPRRIE